MVSVVTETVNWLKGSKYGYTFKDKIALFLYIGNAIIFTVFIIGIFGKARAADIYFKRTYLLNWIPLKSVLVKRNGIILSLPMTLDYIILVKPDWEVEELMFLRKLNLDNNNSIVIDIGSNIGIYTLILLHLYPKCKVISIEASPTIFEKLKLNCQLNSLPPGPNLVLLNKAVSDKDDSLVEFYEKHSISTLSKEFLTNISKEIITKENEEQSKTMVRTITIDKLVETENVNEISLMKIDVEGAEGLVLKGAIDTLNNRKVKNMIIEYHSIENYDYAAKLLDRIGYSIVNSQRWYDEDYKSSNGREFVNGHIIACLRK
ncbi:MAG TPA: FkbM family methyltransferase [Nitrososphaeraceae archaeon]|nr:FkbM family methyltransferase [Nitrososphaeraceae archaeon]